MTRLVAAVLVLLSGCGAPLEPTCIEATVSCDNRCFSVCQYGEWVTLRCLSCGESMAAVGANACSIEPEACVVPN